jgi:hypothetical protein
MQRVMGFLLYKYAPNTAAIDDFYDLSLLRTVSKNGNSDDQNLPAPLEVLPAMQRTIATGTYSHVDFVRFVNTGTVDLQVWSSNNETSAAPTNAITLAPEENINITIGSIADGSSNLTYIIVSNTDTTEKGKIVVVVE